MAALRTSARHDETVYGLWFIVAYSDLQTETAHSPIPKECFANFIKKKNFVNLCACFVYLCVTNQPSEQPAT